MTSQKSHETLAKQTLHKPATATYEANRSKFIAHLVPIADFATLREQLKGEHPKASHIVYATRELNAQDQIVENSSDDGEPRGVAGVPTLNVLRGNDLINVALLTVRYFGGTKLGTGGMVRAYGGAAKAVVSVAELIPWQKRETIQFITAYSHIESTLYHLKKLSITEYTREFGIEEVIWTVSTTSERIKQLKRLDFILRKIYVY